MKDFNLKKYLVEGKLLKEEDFENPILDKYLEIKNSIDHKTVFPYDLQSFLVSLGKTELEGLEIDLKNMGLEIDLAENKLLKENAPGYNTRKSGEALPTSKSVKAAYEAKQQKTDLKEYIETPYWAAELATAAESAYDEGAEISEILSFIERHLGSKYGDY